MTSLPSVAALLRARRKDLGLSFRETARRAAGPSEGTVRRYETEGVSRAPLSVARIASVLGITPADLMDAGSPEAASKLKELMAQGPQSGPDDAGIGWDQLMGEIFGGLADIDAAELPETGKARLRHEFIAGLARDAAERRRRTWAIWDIITPAG